MGFKKQFCINGHDTSICGRNSKHACLECKRERHKRLYKSHPSLPKQFCPKGHDTFVTGRYRYKYEKTSHADCVMCHKENYILNKEQYKISAAKWKQENREAYNAYHRNRYHTNINHKLASRIRNRINDVMSGKVKVSHVLDVLGCSLDFLKVYIESQFTEGMSWDNWNKWGWHIDHIAPLANFDLTDKEQFAKAIHYTNLQPMWAQENWSKGNRVS